MTSDAQSRRTGDDEGHSYGKRGLAVAKLVHEALVACLQGSAANPLKA